MAADDETEESGGQDKNGRVGMYRHAMCKRHGEKSLVFTISRDPPYLRGARKHEMQHRR